MKKEFKIRERIEDINKAMQDLNDRGNLTEEQFNEFQTKIETLNWVLK